jgi:hypothetical protein
MTAAVVPNQRCKDDVPHAPNKDGASIFPAQSYKKWTSRLIILTPRKIVVAHAERAVQRFAPPGAGMPSCIDLLCEN